MPVTISRRDRTGGFRHGGEFRVGEREGHRVSHFHFCLVAKMVPTRVGTSGLTLLGCGNRLQRKRFETTETKRQQFLQDFATFSRATRFAEWFAEGAGQIDAARRRLPWAANQATGFARNCKRTAQRAPAFHSAIWNRSAWRDLHPRHGRPRGIAPARRPHPDRIFRCDPTSPTRGEVNRQRGSNPISSCFNAARPRQ